MTLKPTNKVSNFATEVPNVALVFDRFGIDYCCAGNLPLGEACAAAGVSIEEVLHSIKDSQRQAPEGITELEDWSTQSLCDVISHIVNKHHQFTRRELVRIEQLLLKICLAHGEHHTESRRIQNLFSHLAQDLHAHMTKEEQVLFPYITSMEEAVARKHSLSRPFFGTVCNPIAMMMREHDAAGEILQ